MALRRANFRLYPTKKVNDLLHYHRRLHKELYNAAVSNRITSYKKFGKSVSYFEQQNCLPDFKEVWTEYKQINSQSLPDFSRDVEKGIGSRWLIANQSFELKMICVL